MKKTLTKLCLLAFLSIGHFQSYGQSTFDNPHITNAPALPDISIKFIDDLERKEDYLFYGFIYHHEQDSILRVPQKELIIEGDTTKALIGVLEELERTYYKLQVAEEILKYITVSGKISDEAGFAEAVKNYLAIKKED